MKRNNKGSLKIRPPCNLLFLYFVVLAISFTRCDAKRSSRRLLNKAPNTHQNSLFLMTAAKLNLIKYLNLDSSSDSSNSGSYGVSSPFTLPPYDSLAPIPLPENAPPYCVYPPNTPRTPSTTIPAPIGYTPAAPFSYLPPFLPIQNPPPSPTPEIVPSPPYFVPSPTILSPPFYEPSPPGFVPNPSPIGFGPSPPSIGFGPRPPVFLPPIVYPPPIGRPPRNTAPNIALWCVAKPSVPDPIIQEAMNYACASGADCDSIQPSGSCFEPNTLFAHASYAFNSYWQRTRKAGGTCEFGGTGMLVTVDPSYDGCHFVFY